MIYAPHILKRLISEITNDSYGRPIQTTSWETICPCRCDDDGVTEVVGENGHVNRAKYHIVCGRNTTVRQGDTIKVENQDGTIRAQGVAQSPKNLNKLPYSEIWV